MKNVCCISVLLSVVTVPDGFLPYGPAYDEVVYFFNRDDGYSNTRYFQQNFLFGCRYYRRFWVRYLSLTMNYRTHSGDYWT